MPSYSGAIAFGEGHRRDLVKFWVATAKSYNPLFKTLVSLKTLKLQKLVHITLVF